MSFGGSVSAMITTLRNNSRPRRRARERLKEYEKHGSGLKGELKFKNISPEELELFRSKIKRKSKNERIRNALIIIPILITLLIFLILKIVAINKADIKADAEDKIKLKNAIDPKINEKFIYNLNDGWARLEKGDYENAKYRFHRAYQLKSDDYMTFFALTTVYIYDCMDNEIDCEIAVDLLNKLEINFASKSEVIKLRTKYNDFLKRKKYK